MKIWIVLLSFAKKVRTITFYAITVYLLQIIQSYPLLMSFLRDFHLKKNEVDIQAIADLCDFSFYCFSLSLIDEMMANKIDIYQIIKECIEIAYETFSNDMSKTFYLNFKIHRNMMHIEQMLEKLSKTNTYVEECQHILKDLSVDFANLQCSWEDKLPILRKIGPKEDDIKEIYPTFTVFTTMLISLCSYLSKSADPIEITSILINFLNKKNLNPDDSPYNLNVEVWPNPILHYFVYDIIKDKFVEVLTQLSKKFKTTVDQLTILLSIIPLRLVAA